MWVPWQCKWVSIVAGKAVDLPVTLNAEGQAQRFLVSGEFVFEAGGCGFPGWVQPALSRRSSSHCLSPGIAML